MSIANAPVSDLFRWLDLTGVLTNAVIGGGMARSAGLDPIGFAALAILSGLGGGIIRDTLLQRGTPIALTDYDYILLALAGAAVAFFMQLDGRVWNRIWPLVDALALGCWAATGAQKTLSVGLGWLPAVLLGTTTAVGGGFVRDVVLRRIPGILGGNTLYATCALIASAVMVVLFETGHPTIGLITATIVGGVLCLLARWRNWMLPQSYDWSPARQVLGRYEAEAKRLRERRAHRTDDDSD